jgi:hypothetical protein
MDSAAPAEMTWKIRTATNRMSIFMMGTMHRLARAVNAACSNHHKIFSPMRDRHLPVSDSKNRSRLEACPTL